MHQQLLTGDCLGGSREVVELAKQHGQLADGTRYDGHGEADHPVSTLQTVCLQPWDAILVEPMKWTNTKAAHRII